MPTEAAPAALRKRLFLPTIQGMKREQTHGMIGWEHAARPTLWHLPEPMRFFRWKNLKECTLCLVTLAVVAGAPILVSVFVLLSD
jgi:hypothetical protein